MKPVNDYISRQKALEKAGPVTQDDIGILFISHADLMGLPAEKVLPDIRCHECFYCGWKPDPAGGRPDHYCKLTGHLILDDTRLLCPRGKARK